jgi:DNA-binding transcriptional MerR regulator
MNYRIQEFAKLTGVTVRALHHYDRLGLLSPERSSGKYRIYRECDLGRLEQIIALKFIGVPLRRIQALLKGDASELLLALRSQRGALEEKQRLLEITIQAIRVAEDGLQRGEEPDASSLKRIIEVMEMQNSEWMMKYFRDEVKERAQARKAAWTPALQARVEQDWSDLFDEAKSALEEDPAGERAQTLVGRFEGLIRELTAGDDQLVHGIKSMYADRENWPAEVRARMEPFLDERIWEFIRKGLEARKRAAD